MIQIILCHGRLFFSERILGPIPSCLGYDFLLLTYLYPSSLYLRNKILSFLFHYVHTHTRTPLPPICPELKLRYNMAYIVCGVVIEQDKVLMIQEAKPSCRGQWYLPAGRMEENETIVVWE